MHSKYLNNLIRPLQLRCSRICHQIAEQKQKPSFSKPNLPTTANAFSGKLWRVLPPMARQMLDSEILTDLNKITDDAASADLLRSYLIKCETPEERHETVVSLSFLVNAHRLSNSACETCLYQKKRCICDLINPVEPRHKLWLFQHVGEFGRSNNTGGLLTLVAGAQRTTRGIREEQANMMKHISKNVSSTVILFPSIDSVTISQYRTARFKAMGSQAEENPLTLILLDGTSRQAKNLDRYIPDIVPRIRLSETKAKSWLDPIRKQTEEHRVCTAQAAAMTLRELGEENTSDAIENAVKEVVRMANVHRYTFGADAHSNDKSRECVG